MPKVVLSAPKKIIRRLDCSAAVKSIMKNILRGVMACLAAAPLVLVRGAEAGTVVLDVEFKLTDPEYHPLPGVPLRLVLGAEDWQAAEAGARVVTGEDGGARFTTQAVIDRRWRWTNIGFTPLSMPSRVDHISVAAELGFAVPRKEGADTIHHWLYTAEIYRYRDGDCSTDDLDSIYQAAADGRFTQLLGSGATGPNFQMKVDGWILTGGGYKLWNFLLSRDETDPTGTHWHLKLALMRMPKAQLR
jgi:hypothetical protein